MTWNLRALTLAAVSPLVLACPASDDGDGSGSESAANDASTVADPTADASGDPPGSELTWGAPCTDNAECVALIGAGAICQAMAVIYELPGGYCTKPCTLPDPDTTVVTDDPTCDPAGGVDCVGSQGFFENCAKPCSDTAECDGRPNFLCRQMPMIAQPTDPTYCLMDDCCLNTCGAC
jgi:hypothetical protein